MFRFAVVLIIAVQHILADMHTIAAKFPNGRIIGGQHAAIETYPHQISLQTFGMQQQNMNLVSSMSPTYQQSEPSPQQTIQQYLMQTTDSPQTPQQQQQQQPQQTQPTTGNSPPDSPIPSTMMGQLMGALNNSALLDDLNINIETLHGFDCDIDEVIKHELLINGTLDINFQQGMNLGSPMPSMVAPNSGMMTSSMPSDLPCDQLTAETAMNHQTTADVNNVTAPNSAASPNWVH